VELTKSYKRVYTAARGAEAPAAGDGVEIFGELLAAEVADDVQYDPGNERVRS
jgi:hypothetical protein